MTFFTSDYRIHLILPCFIYYSFRVPQLATLLFPALFKGNPTQRLLPALCLVGWWHYATVRKIYFPWATSTSWKVPDSFC